MEKNSKFKALLVSKTDFVHKENENDFYINGDSPYGYEQKVSHVILSNKLSSEVCIFSVFNGEGSAKTNKKIATIMQSELKKAHGKVKRKQNIDVVLQYMKTSALRVAKTIYTKRGKGDFAILIVCAKKAVSLYFGSGRIYLNRNGRIQYMMPHFEKIERLLEIGLIEKSQIKDFTEGNVSPKTGKVHVEVSDVIDICDGDLFMLSTNTLDDIKDHEKSIAELQEYKDFNLIANILKKEAYKGGVKDNLNGLIIEVEKAGYPMGLPEKESLSMPSWFNKKAVVASVAILVLGTTVALARPWNAISDLYHHIEYIVTSDPVSPTDVPVDGIPVGEEPIEEEPTVVAFEDVDFDHQAYDAIEWMVNNEMINGYPDNTFHPDEPITRAELARMIAKVLELELDPSETASFIDLSTNHWAYQYIEASKEYFVRHKISEGYYYEPEKAITKEDMAMALAKAYGYDAETTDESILEDLRDREEINPNLSKYVAIAIKNNIIEVDPSDETLFRPSNPITRAESAVLFYELEHDKE